MPLKNIKIDEAIHHRLKIHADVLRQQVSELAGMYLYEAMRIAERTNGALKWLQDHTLPKQK